MLSTVQIYKKVFGIIDCGVWGYPVCKSDSGENGQAPRVTPLDHMTKTAKTPVTTQVSIAQNIILFYSIVINKTTIILFSHFSDISNSELTIVAGKSN